MPNKTYAKEWLVKVYHDIGSAKILYEVGHYTDSIGVDLHYAIEKLLKTFLAYENKSIPKIHDLPKLYELVKEYISFEEDEENILYVANKYHIEMSYPMFESTLPDKEEIKEVLDFSQKLLDRVCNILDIKKEELK